MKRTLNGTWQFRQLGTAKWMDAAVPGCNFLDLMNNELIPDPLAALNESKLEWVGTEDWEYKRLFEINAEELLYDDIMLNAKMLDTICDVYINDRRMFSGVNCFRAYCQSVKEYLVEGKNEIKIIFSSPVNYVSEQYRRCVTPVNANGQNGIVHIRKPQCHFGWDWGPVLPCSGISDDIELVFVSKGRIDNFYVTQKVTNGTAVINAEVDLVRYGDCQTEIAVICPDGTQLKSVGEGASFRIDKPQLWWTRELSRKTRQPLYAVRARVYDGDSVVDEVVKKIGLRSIELNREPDEYGNNFQFVLNGVPLFIKGANYIPPDSFITRFDKKKLNDLLNAVQFSNMNMLRIWGGGYYGSDELYNACDERGILIWQDFQFACQAYPFFIDEFLDNVIEEIKYNVKRLCHHPSLALWCGNNEIEDMHMAWMHMTKYVEYTEKFFYHILPDELRRLDTQTPYTPGSPIGVSHNKGMGADNVGDTHLWAVWHGLKPTDYYRTRLTRFCSEFGLESLPDIKTIKRIADGNENYSLSSDVMIAHQKCNSGNDKMLYYIASRFKLPVRIEDYVYLSQITQLECVADATEHWRRNKGRCNGSIYWQLNDCWGASSWSSIDYYGNFKALQYGARRFNAPLSVSIEDNDEQINIFVLNDYKESHDIIAEYKIFNFKKGVLKRDYRELKVDAVNNTLVFRLRMKDIKSRYDLSQTGIVARLYEKGRMINQKVLLFDNEKKLSLPKAKLTTQISIEEDRLRLLIKTDNYARLVRLESSKSNMHFSDNFFDLLPNEYRVITIKTDASMTPRELAESIRISSLCNVKTDKSKFGNFWARAKVRLSLSNFGTSLYHGRKASDIKLKK